MAKGDHERTIMVRMERTTHDRLKALRERMVAYAQQFPGRADGRLIEDTVSLSTVIDILVDRWVAHKKRSYRSRRRQLPKNNGSMPPAATELGG